MMGWGGGDWHWWGYGALHMLVYWGLLVLVVVVLVRWLIGKDRNRRADGDSALEILKERYVRGEIQKEEFEQKKHDLTGR